MTFELANQALLQSGCLINGAWTGADDNSTRDVTNPADGSKVGVMANAGSAEAQRAVEAAEKALTSWRETSADERAALLMKWHDLMLANQEDLARLMTAEQGKPLGEARGEIAYGASYLKWFAEEARRLYGDVIPAPGPDKRVLVIRQAVGVVACITPWNFPNAMLTRKIAPALAAGCTVVCKPATATPLSALAVGQLAIEAGIPAGVVNIVTGKTAEIGDVLTTHPAIRKVSFTGSTEVGKELLKACADTVKRTSMELGGNAPFIVFDDADLDAAVEGAIICKFRNAGQTCVCANRIYVQSGVYDEFARRLAARASDMKVGNGLEEGTEVGPLIDDKAVDFVMGLIDDSRAAGAEVLSGGARHDAGELFIAPTVMTGGNSEMRIHNEEIFGPVAMLYRFDSEEEIIRLANDTPFGLASYFYARDIGRIWRVAEGLEYGIVGINEGIISNAAAPFGGVKESGQGREGSKYGLDDYTEIKYLCMGGIDK
ncbi:MAG: succinate-semialdehyde dehydrogenase (NADP(+)) [Gammaproteobacteria bacterium]|nr:MAG: succinate-semialdehyde dehydrogenase (NADP(+)) [Gammaproteobacteria bacterium]